MNFGIRLKELRVKNNLTQQSLADKLDIPRSTVAGYETKGYEPNFETLIKICDLFNVSADSLLGRVNNINSIESKNHYSPVDINDIEYLNIAKELKEKNLTPDEVKMIIDIVMLYKNKKQE